mgnify:CR=1 FL=1
MPELLQEYWLLILAALVIGIVVAWWIFHASRRTRVELEDKPSESGGAKRNQALIDAPPVASAAPGPISVAATADKVAATSAIAEAGAAVSAREAIRKTADVPPGETPEAQTARPRTEETAQADDLRRIKGLGPKLVSLLAEHGITSFAQIAAWDDAEIDRIDAQLGRFQGRIRRDDWVAQARFLAAEDIAGYEDRFGKV